jgi:predicted small lipoprotein YifL
MEAIALTPIRRALRPLVFLASLALVAASLAGCGRRGPLELPPETQARGQFLKTQEEARAASARSAAKPRPGMDDAGPKQPEAIPGTIGHRPPEQYPFPLDPLL